MSQPNLKASKRVLRANRILDVAAELVLRWGYNKTTIDDIVREARVAKGTIYLHWKTREELFRALLKREQLALGAEFQQRVSADPEGVMLRGIFKHTALALMARPLLKAFLLRDISILGKLAETEHTNAAYLERVNGFGGYLEFLRHFGLVRSDLSTHEAIYTLSAIFTGFLMVDPLMPPALRLPDDVLADRVGDAIERALSSGRKPTADELQAASALMADYMSHTLALAAAEFEKELEAGPSSSADEPAG